MAIFTGVNKFIVFIAVTLAPGLAAVVALMGQTRGKYTFFGHLKWMPVIALGYAVSIQVHMWINVGYL